MNLRSVLFFLGAAVPALAAPNALRVEHGYPFMDVMVNGAGPFRMLIDTGADSCMLTPKAAAAAGVAFDGRVSVASVTGDRLERVSSHNEVRVGDRARSGVEFAVSSLDGLRQVDTRVDGVIGQSFLRQAPYLIDYRARMLWLDDEAVARGSQLESVIESAADSRETVVPVAIGGQTRRLMLDSGASDLILECDNGCPKLMSVESVSVRTNQGAGQAQRGVLPAMEIGGARWTSRPAALLARATSERDGLLPASLFAAVYVDAPHHLVRFHGMGSK